jgi:NADPH-dependent curcumin reductase CurA
LAGTSLITHPSEVMMPTTGRAWQLVRRPHGEPVADDFALVDQVLPAPGPGEILVRNTWLSVDPYMRGRMIDAESYVPPFALDAAMDGGAVGVVEAVGDDVAGLDVGATVLHGLGWRDLVVLPAAAVKPVDVGAAPAQAYLGVLGMPGLTAYAGLLRVAELGEGETVFVSGAGGAVGSLVGQIARIKGATQVIGSAGGPQKCQWLLDEAGFSNALDYRAAPIRRLLSEAAPQGIDVYFDNVGGDHLEAAIGALRPHGRAALCGAISVYNSTEPPSGPRNLTRVIQNRLTLRGFVVTDHQDLAERFAQDVGGWLRDGRLVWRETVAEGIGSAVDAFRSLLSGGNTGKMLVRLDPDA